MGFEPTTNGTTIRYSNLLSYIHHFNFAAAKINDFFVLCKNSYVSLRFLF